MKFIRKSKYCEQSECGEYTVCKIGSAKGWTYESWKKQEQLAVGLKSADAARDFCKRHLGESDEALQNQ